MNCKNCGAPLSPDDKICPYCGSHIERELTPEEKAREAREEERIKLEALPKFKYASGGFMIFATIFTFGLYSLYWYISRRKSFIAIAPEQRLPDLNLAIAINTISYICAVFVTDHQQVFNITFSLWILCSLYIAFRVKTLFASYAAKNIDRINAVKLIAPSNLALIFIGSIYLQIQINKMQALGLAALEV